MNSARGINEDALGWLGDARPKARTAAAERGRELVNEDLAGWLCDPRPAPIETIERG